MQLGFSSEVAKLLVREQGLDRVERLSILTDKNFDDICDVMRKPGGKIADRTPNRGQHVSVIAQESMKLAAIFFHHQWRCTFDWEVTGVPKNTVHLLADRRGSKMNTRTQTCCLKSTRLIWQE